MALQHRMVKVVKYVIAIILTHQVKFTQILNENGVLIICFYFRHLSIYTIKHNYKKYIHTINI